jgi:electron transport complex protein RnfD
LRLLPAPRSGLHRVLLAMLPGFVLHAALVDPTVLLRLVVLTALCLICEVPFARRRGHASVDLAALVTAMILALALPATLPLALVALTGVIAILVGRHAVEGFNPAMLAYATLAVLLPATLYLPTDADSGATLLAQLSNALKQQQTVAEWQSAHTASTGPLALVALAWLAGASWLARRGQLRWRIAAGVLTALCACALLPWMLDTDRHLSPLAHLLSGSAVFAACFVATDPGSSPRGQRAQWAYGLLLGALLYAIRTWGHYPDGIAFAVLLSNAAAPLVARLCASTTPASSRT